MSDAESIYSEETDGSVRSQPTVAAHKGEGRVLPLSPIVRHPGVEVPDVEDEASMWSHLQGVDNPSRAGTPPTSTAGTLGTFPRGRPTEVRERPGRAGGPVRLSPGSPRGPGAGVARHLSWVYHVCR